jgi:NADPH2:quinone reductase
MKAVLLREIGGDLTYEDVPEPEGETIEVKAAGINFSDVLIRTGNYPQAPELPVVLGGEVAGELDGRRVMALTLGRGGGYAERAAVDPTWLADLPEGASFAEGASFLTTYLTAWIPLKSLVEPGQTVLVHAAAGGVGTAAVQLAKHLGARVVATAGSSEKLEVALEAGADETASYDEFPKADVILDPVGGDVFARSLTALEPMGTLVAIGYAAGAWADVSPALLVGRNISVQGFYLGRLMGHRPDLVRAAIDELLVLWTDGAVKPVVGAEFPLERAGEAHELIASRRSFGKVVLVP